jgi:hypothetical protein
MLVPVKPAKSVEVVLITDYALRCQHDDNLQKFVTGLTVVFFGFEKPETPDYSGNLTNIIEYNSIKHSLVKKNCRSRGQVRYCQHNISASKRSR